MRGVRVDVGTLIAGRFEVTGLLGGGGMALVYRALDRRHDRPAAVKVMQARLARTPEFRERFDREAKFANRAFHPNILPVWDAGEDHGVFYIATPLADLDLGELIADGDPMPAHRALSLLAQVAWALDFAHSRDVIHRDVKPENILLVRHPGDQFHVWLGDFGIARSDGQATLTSALMPLSVHYASPEQIRGEQLDGRADQYSLACTLYDALTGDAPFADTDQQRVLEAQLEASPPHLSERRPDLPEQLDAALRRGLAKSRGERYGTCAELIEACAAAAEAAPGVASAPEVATSVPRRDSEETAADDAADATIVEREADETVLDPAGPKAAGLRRHAKLVALACTAALAIAGGLTVALAGGGGDGYDEYGTKDFDGPGSETEDRRAQTELIRTLGVDNACQTGLVSRGESIPAGETARVTCYWITLDTDKGGLSDFSRFDSQPHYAAAFPAWRRTPRPGKPVACPDGTPAEGALRIAGGVRGRRVCYAIGDSFYVRLGLDGSRVIADFDSISTGDQEFPRDAVWSEAMTMAWLSATASEPSRAAFSGELDRAIEDGFTCDPLAKETSFGLPTPARPAPEAVAVRACSVGQRRFFQLFRSKRETLAAFRRFSRHGTFIPGGREPRGLKPVRCGPHNDYTRGIWWRSTRAHPVGQTSCLRAGDDSVMVAATNDAAHVVEVLGANAVDPQDAGRAWRWWENDTGFAR